MAKVQSPLLGFNNNVRHKGRVFHIQTEDSGVKFPHVITHLFADGGRILKSLKTSYAEHLDSENLEQTVRNLMKDQHKAMFIALRDGQFDEVVEQTDKTEAAKDDPTAVSQEAPPPTKPAQEDSKLPDLSGPGKYSTTRPAAIFAPPKGTGLFGEEVISDKSLDEVILGFLSEEFGAFSGDEQGK